MARDNTPFLANEDAEIGSQMSSENMAPLYHAPKRSLWGYAYPIIQVFTVCLALWGGISIFLEGTKLFMSHQDISEAGRLGHEEHRPDPYHPETLKPGLNVCDCGTTVQEALQRECVFDILSVAWLPPHCRDEELTAEFKRSGPETDNQWYYYADKEGTIRMNETEIGVLGETGGSFWASRDWHIMHCMFYWQKYTRVRDTGAVMEQLFDNLSHVKHCTHLATKAVPDNVSLIDVVVRMNSSIIWAATE